MTRKKSDGDYFVGRGKPPKDKQFKKGKSGNESGRRPGSKNKPRPDETACIIEEEGRAMMDVKVRGKAQKMPTKRAIARAIFNSAASGNTRAQRIAMDLLMKTENKRRDENNMRFEAAVKLKEWWAEESKRRKSLGLPEPDFYKHPDNILLDYATGEIGYVGMTPDQEKLTTMLLDLKAIYEAALWDLSRSIDASDFDPEHSEMILQEFAHIVRVLRAINTNLGLGWCDKCDKSPDWDAYGKLRDKVVNDLKKGV